MDSFRDLLEENAYCLTNNNTSALVPFVLKQEEECILKEISGKVLLVILNGTTILGEALAIIFHFIREEWILAQSLIHL